MEFKVGDRVRMKDTFCGNTRFAGETGTVVNPRGEYDVGVEFDNPVGRHNCDGHGKDGYCYYGYDKELELLNGNSNLTETKMEKKLFKVLVVDKKTGETKKEANVVADDAQSALLRAFGVDAENSFMKIDEVGRFDVKEPVQAVIVKSEK